jgi:hypothetical protein
MRAITGFGVNPFLGLTIGTGIFIWMSIIVFKKVNYPQYFYSFLSLVVITTLSNKSRNDFLKITFFRKKYFIIRIFENLIYSIPFLFFLAYKGEYLVALITIVMSSLFSLITFSGKSALVIPTPFSKRPYEFSIGFRRTYLLLIILIIISFISIFDHNFNLGIVCLFGMFLVCITYYSEQEPVFYVWIYAQSPQVFLRKKIKTALYFSFLLSLFIAIPLICFNTSYTYQVALVIVIGLLDMVLIVVGIYSNYPARLNLIQNIQIITAIVFPPLLLFAIPNLYYQAKRRLNVFLI